MSVLPSSLGVVFQLMLVLGLVWGGSLRAQVVKFEALPVKGGKASTSACSVFGESGKGKVLVTVVALGADKRKATLEWNGKSESLSLMASDINSRLALYQIPASMSGLEGSLSTLGSSTALQPADPVFVSKPEGKESARVVGRVDRFQAKTLPLAVIRLNHEGEAPLPGTAILDAKGQWVGIVRQAVFGQKNSSYCLPIEVMSRTLKDYKKNGKIRRCWVGIVMDERVASPIIESVRPESPAQKAGLKNGDVLLKVGSLSVRDYASVVDSFFYLIAGEPATFVVLRGTTVMKIPVQPEVSPGKD